MAFSFSAWTPVASEVAPREHSSASECSSSARPRPSPRAERATASCSTHPRPSSNTRPATQPTGRSSRRATQPRYSGVSVERHASSDRSRVSGHLVPRSVDVDQRVHGSVILAAPVARDGDPAGPDRGRKRRVDAAMEIEERAPMGEAVRLQPRDPPRVAGVAVDLVMALARRATRRAPPARAPGHRRDRPAGSSRCPRRPRHNRPRDRRARRSPPARRNRRTRPPPPQTPRARPTRLHPRRAPARSHPDGRRVWRTKHRSHFCAPAGTAAFAASRRSRRAPALLRLPRSGLEAAWPHERRRCEGAGGPSAGSAGRVTAAAARRAFRSRQRGR